MWSRSGIAASATFPDRCRAAAAPRHGPQRRRTAARLDSRSGCRRTRARAVRAEDSRLRRPRAARRYTPPPARLLSDKPTRDFSTIWNLCFGIFGIQFGLALQNSNLSRIFQTLGADGDAIPTLWIAAPLTGLLVQPVIGHYSV